MNSYADSGLATYGYILVIKIAAGLGLPILRLPHTANTPRDCLKCEGRAWLVLENRRQSGSTKAACRKDCYRLEVVSYSSDPSGDRVGVPEAILRHYDRFAGHATPQRPPTTAKTDHN